MYNNKNDLELEISNIQTKSIENDLNFNLNK